MDPLERFLAKMLAPHNVTYLPGSYNKRFASSMAAMAERPNAMCSPKQRALLISFAVRYRRQLFAGRQLRLIEAAKKSGDPTRIEAAIIACVSGLMGQ